MVADESATRTAWRPLESWNVVTHGAVRAVAEAFADDWRQGVNGKGSPEAGREGHSVGSGGPSG